MSITLQLLDEWKAAKKIASDNQAAIRLGLGRATVSKWRNDPSAEANPATMIKLAKELGKDPDPLLLEVATRQATTPEVRDLLGRLARKLTSMGMLCAPLLLALVQNGNCVEVHNYTNPQFNIMSDVLYIHADIVAIRCVLPQSKNQIEAWLSSNPARRQVIA